MVHNISNTPRKNDQHTNLEPTIMRAKEERKREKDKQEMSHSRK